jgi:Protein of unknown function (DUF3761)
VFFRATFVAAAILTAAIGSASPAHSSPGPCYIGSSGDCVPYPTHASTPPPCATAICVDGDYSCSEHPHASGTCHGHGGVQRYL